MSVPGLAEIEKFPSFVKKNLFISPGEIIRPTIDMFTIPGSVVLVHEDKNVLKANVDRIRELEQDGLFEVN